MTLQASGAISLKDIWEEKSGISYSANFKNLSLRGMSSNIYTDYFDVPASQNVNIIGTPNGSSPYFMSEFYDWTSNTEVNQGSSGTTYGYQSGSYGSISGNTKIPNTNINITGLYRLVFTFKGSSTYTFFVQAASSTTQTVFTSVRTSGVTFAASTATFTNNDSWSWGLTSTQLTDWDGSGTLQVEWTS